MGFFNKKPAVVDPIALLKRGKSAEQCKAIDYFYVGDQATASATSKGCLKKVTVNITKKWDMSDYLAYIQNKINSLNLKERAIAKIGLDESQISEIAPVAIHAFQRYDTPFKDSKSELRYRYEFDAEKETWSRVTNIYNVTWIFFSATQIYTYTYTFDALSNNAIETTRDFFYSDITCIRTEHEVDEKIDPKKVEGCFKKSEEWVHHDIHWDTLKIVVPGYEYSFTCTTTPTLDQSIMAVKAMIREKKDA